MTIEDHEVKATPGVSSPYRGLMPYTEQDAEYFFGREADIVLIANNARANRFGVLYGPSGVGKSSVLRAGVVWHIRKENRMRYERFNTVETVIAYLKEWRDDPYAALREVVLEAFHETPGVSAPTVTPGTDAVDGILELRESQRVDLIVILDQFEEFFLYHQGEASAFAEELARLTERGSRVNVLVSIREDALARLDDFESDIPEVFDNTLRLDHLDRDAAEDAIRKPLEFFNSGRPVEEQVTIEDELVEELLRQLRAGRVHVDSSHEAAPAAAPGHEEVDTGEVRVEAPFLQLVLARLWHEEVRRGSLRMRVATLHELGGAQEIVRQHLDRVMRAFSAPELAVLADAFGHLVTPSGSKIAHRPSDLAEFSGRDDATVAALMRRLAAGDQRILREVPPPMDEPHAEPRYEIFHDVLALAVLDWRRRYLAEADSQRQHSKLVADRDRIERETRETRRRLRRARSVVAGMALLLVACVVLALLTWNSLGDAQEAKQAADLNAVLDDVNRLLHTDPAAALTRAQELRLGGDDDPSGRFQDAYRRAFDAADTEVMLELGSPVVLARFDEEDHLVTVTEDGHVRVWEVTGQEPLRLDDDPLVDVVASGADSARVTQALTAVAGRYVVAATETGTISSVDLRSGEVAELDLALEGDVFISAADTGDRNLVVAVDYEKHGALWDVAADRVISSPALQRELSWAAIDPEGDFLAVGKFFKKGIPGVDVQVWGVASERKIIASNLASSTLPVYSEAWFTGGTGLEIMAVAVGYKSEAFLWDPLSLAAPTRLETDLPWRNVFDFATVKDTAGGKGERHHGLVAVAGDKSVQLFDARGSARGGVVGKTVESQDWVTQVETNPADPTEFAVAGDQGDVELYRQLDLRPSRPIWTYRGHTGEISDLTYSEDGEHLVTASRDGTVRVWRLPSQTTAWHRNDWILGAKYTADGDHLLGFTPDGEVTSYDGTRTTDGSGAIFGQAQSMDASPDGLRAVLSTDWCLEPVVALLAGQDDDAVELDETEGDAACPTGVIWNPDPAASQIVAGTYDGRLVVWDADTGHLTGSPVDLGEGSREVQDLAFAGDGGTIVASTGTAATGKIHVLRTSDLSVVAEWATSGVSTLAVSHDGRVIATANNDRRQVQVWDVSEVDAPAQVFDQSAGTLSDVTLSPDPDASRVALTTSEGLVHVWDRETGRLLSSMRRHADMANEAVFHPQDIDRMASAGDDGVMVTFVCDLCSIGPDETEALEAAAEDRLVQVVPVTD